VNAKARLRRTAGKVRRAIRLRRRQASEVALYRVPINRFVTYSYNALFRRDPDPWGIETYHSGLLDGSLSRADVLDHLRGSMEMRFNVPYTDLLVSLHHSRCDFVRSFPRAGRILDLGGTDQHNRDGALVAGLRYPYPFDELIIVDLPHDDRHALYQGSAPADRFETRLGPVQYRYHSMADLSGIDDASIDLVYSGQTIEHVTPSDADLVLKEVARVLRPGGWLYLDTPNGPVCRLQQPDFINPDHKAEYSLAELEAKIVAAGLEVVDRKGLNYLGHPHTEGGFDRDEVARNTGLYGEPEDCYLLAVACRRPTP
jgi:hypothetical protein